MKSELLASGAVGETVVKGLWARGHELMRGSGCGRESLAHVVQHSRFP